MAFRVLNRLIAALVILKILTVAARELTEHAYRAAVVEAEVAAVKGYAAGLADLYGPNTCPPAPKCG